MTLVRAAILGRLITVTLLATLLTVPSASAGKLLDEMKVKNTCGTTYANKLTTCSAFQCQQPSPMAMMFGFPSEDELKKMPPEQQQKMREAIATAEKKMETMSASKRAAMKAKMVSLLKILQWDKQGRCKTSTIAIPGQQMDCAFDSELLAKVAAYTKLAATADHIKTSSTSKLVNGKMVTQQIDTIDGKEMANPWKEALDKGQCKMVDIAIPKKPHRKELNGKQDTNTLFILDASGSMWGQIKGKPKMTIAKEVMTKLVSELPDNGRVGLIAYGHRRKGDCSDVETLVSLGDKRKSALLDAVKGLHAKGKTPLTRSVNQAFKMLQAEKNISTVVLVSDGIESCGGDPCAAVKAANASGINFVLHTVGFGLSSQQSEQLQCMANAGGGEYFQANNADELLKSTRKAVKTTAKGTLKLTLNSNGKPVNAWVKLVGDDSIGLVALTNDKGVKPGHIWHLRSGIYRLETYPAGLRGVEPIVVDKIKIESAKTVDKVLSFDQSVVRVKATNNGKQAMVQIKISDLATNKTVFDSSTFSTFTMNGVKTPYEVKVLPGKYRLTVTLPQSSVPPYILDTDSLSGGQVVEKTANFETGAIRVTAQVNNEAHQAAVRIVESNTRHKNFESMPYVGIKTPVQVKLAAGSYDIFVTPIGIDGMAEKSVTNIEVKPGDTIDEIVIFGAELIVPDYAKHLGDGKWTAWNSSEGAMGLMNAGAGKYVGFFKQKNGRFLLQRSGSNMTGFWIQNTSDQQCATERDGSRYWGRINWVFNKEFNSFSGAWSYCDANPSGNTWSGNRGSRESTTTHNQTGGQSTDNMEQDTDRPWNDYRDFIPASADPLICQKACQAEAQCKAWTYVKPNTQGPEAHCYLKSAVPDAHHSTCCISGTKQ